MAIERTLSIIKPDATRRNLTGKINAKFEEAGLRIVAQKRIKLTMDQAGKFYEVHKERPFYGELCEFMASEPVVAQAPADRRTKRLTVTPFSLRSWPTVFLSSETDACSSRVTSL